MLIGAINSNKWPLGKRQTQDKAKKYIRETLGGAKNLWLRWPRLLRLEEKGSAAKICY